MTSDVTIILNKKGKIKRVKRGNKVLRAKRKPRGSKKGTRVVGLLTLELLAHGRTKKKGGPGKDKGDGEGNDGGGTDPCCFRDAGSGTVWCWC